jgi:hypothetical protein
MSGNHSHFKTWWKYGDFTNEIQHGILGFAGIKARVTVYGPCEKATDSCKSKWMQQVEKFARRGI